MPVHRLIAILAIALSACSPRITVMDGEVVGFVRSPFTMATVVEWTLYEVDSNGAVPLLVTDMSRSIGCEPPEQQCAACILHTAERRDGVVYRMGLVGARRWSNPAPSDPRPRVDCMSGPATVVFGCDVVQEVPRGAERIVWVAGQVPPPGIESMSVGDFVAQATGRRLILVVRWYEQGDEFELSAPSASRGTELRVAADVRQPTRAWYKAVPMRPAAAAERRG